MIKSAVIAGKSMFGYSLLFENDNERQLHLKEVKNGVHLPNSVLVVPSRVVGGDFGLCCVQDVLPLGFPGQILLVGLPGLGSAILEAIPSL